MLADAIRALFGAGKSNEVPNDNVKVDADFLAEHKVRPWGDMPVWMPPRGETAAFMRRSVKRALEKGLTYRPLSLTAKDTLDFYDSEPDDRKEKLRAGLDPAREKEVLRLWHAKQKSR